MPPAQRRRDLPLPVVALAATTALAGATSVGFGLHLLAETRSSWLATLWALVVIATGPCVWLAAWLAARWLRGVVRETADLSRRLEGAAATGHEVVWEIAPDGTLTYISDVARELFGVRPEELVGQPVFVVLPPNEQQRARAVLDQCVRERRGWSGLTFQALHAQGGLRWIETTAVAHLDHTGLVQGLTATSRRMDDAAVARIAIEQLRERVDEVVTGRRLRTVFQPIVDVDAGHVAGFEALTRVDADPTQPPDRWFADAHSVGRAVDLDCLAVQTALFAAQRLPQDAYVSVNVVPATLECGRLLPILRAGSVPGHRLVVEITEHVSVEDYRTLREPLDELRALGVRLAVDDAGSGYASFRHILRLRPEFIKLDQELIRDLHGDPAKRALAAAVVMFALDVGATVIAEGVETTDELDMVAVLGIDAAQGYLLGRPTDDVAALTAARHAGPLRQINGEAAGATPA